MFRVQSIGIAVAMICFLFVIGVQKSDAIKIVDFPSDTEDTSYNGYTYHMAYVETDVPIYHVSWSIDGKWAYSETLDSTTKYASYFPCYDPTASDKIPGVIKGKKYEIGVTVWEWDADAEEFRDTSASYKVRMFEPKVISGIKYPRATPEHKLGEGIYGSVTLWRHYHDGWNIVVSASVYARNRTKIDVYASEFYRHTEFKDLDGDGLDETVWSLEDPRPGKPLPPGETYSNSGSSMISFHVGGDIGKDQVIKLNAHIHLAVGGRVWHEENGAWTHTFTDEDNESYGDDQ